MKKDNENKNMTKQALKALVRHMILRETDRTLTPIAMFVWVALIATIYTWYEILMYFIR